MPCACACECRTVTERLRAMDWLDARRTDRSLYKDRASVTALIQADGAHKAKAMCASPTTVTSTRARCCTTSANKAMESMASPFALVQTREKATIGACFVGSLSPPLHAVPLFPTPREKDLIARNMLLKASGCQRDAAVGLATRQDGRRSQRERFRIEHGTPLHPSLKSATATAAAARTSFTQATATRREPGAWPRLSLLLSDSHAVMPPPSRQKLMKEVVFARFAGRSGRFKFSESLLPRLVAANDERTTAAVHHQQAPHDSGI